MKMFIQPMLLQPSLPFNDSNYLTELKADGIRLIYSHFDNKVNLNSVPKEVAKCGFYKKNKPLLHPRKD